MPRFMSCQSGKKSVGFIDLMWLGVFSSDAHSLESGSAVGYETLQLTHSLTHASIQSGYLPFCYIVDVSADQTLRYFSSCYGSPFVLRKG